MRVLTGGRASGKTYEAIKYASENGLYILVSTRDQCTNIFQMANKLNLPIPYPIAVDDLTSGKIKGTSIERDGIVVDNTFMVLEKLLPVPVNMATVEVEDEE